MSQDKLALMLSQLKVVCAKISVTELGTGYKMKIESTGAKEPRWAYFNSNFIRVNSRRNLI